jgi:hypothetical protein
VRTRRLLAVAAVATSCATAFAAAAGASGASHLGTIKTPNGHVYCDYAYDAGNVSYVRCGFNGRLIPQEKKPAGGCRMTDYVGNRMVLRLHGKGTTEPCAGDAGPFENPKAAKAIPFGHTWHGGPFSCKSSRSGMTCRSTDGHGFRLAKRHWRVF